MLRSAPKRPAGIWIVSAILIALGTVPTVWAIASTWRTIGAIELALPRAGFEGLRELNIMIRDVTVLKHAAEMARADDDEAAALADLKHAADLAYIRFFRQAHSTYYPLLPTLPLIEAEVKGIISGLDEATAGGGRPDAAMLTALVPQLARAITDLSRLYYAFGDNMDKVLLEQQEALGGFKLQLISILAIICVLGLGSAVLLINRNAVALQMRQIATRDVLTGLLNRTWFMQSAPKLLASRPLALLMIDLDHFKQINDTFGHPVGDLLLKEAAARLQCAVRPDDIIVRLAGDEFAVLAQNVGSGAAADIAARIVSVTDGTVMIDGNHLRMSCSVGLAVYPDHGLAMDDLLAHADLALYAAKRDGRNRFAAFTPALAEQLTSRTALESAILRALGNEEFSLAWQPQLTVASDRVESAEALIRWFDKGAGRWISPAEFIPVAEESELIQKVDGFVLEAACREGLAIQASLGRDFRISVNVSARNVEREAFPDELETILRRTRFPASALEIEITESALMRSRETCARVIRRLCQLGVRIAIDDFGTGYSNLSYLADLHVDRLKIDRSLLPDGAASDRKRAILSSIVQFARALDLQTVAEGVETPAQLAAVASAGCSFAQGYLIAKPLGLDELVTIFGSQGVGRARRQPAVRLVGAAERLPGVA